MPRSPHTIILGGGLAGIAAALRLAERGVPVTLVETRKRLGGRATSFDDPQTGQTLDNCQHVLMGCCTNLIDLYRRLGVERDIEWHRRLYFCDVGRSEKSGVRSEEKDQSSQNIGAGLTESKSVRNPQSEIRNPKCGSPSIDLLESDDLPAPLHMTRSLMAFTSLTLMEKLAISRAMLAIMRLGASGRAALHGISFAQWLADQSQPRGAIEKYWDPVVISALNELPGRCAADYAIHVFQDGFLCNADAYVMGLSRVPLVRLYDAAEKAIASAGGRVLFSASAERLEFESDIGRVAALQLADGGRIEADAFVSALPHDRLAKVITPAMAESDARLRRLTEFDTSPIIGIHLWFDAAMDRNGDRESVMTLPHLTLMRSPLQWIFNKGVEFVDRPPESDRGSQKAGARSQENEYGTIGAGGKPKPAAQHLHGVISAAHDLVDLPAERIIDIVVAEVRRALPGARAASLLHARVVKEKRATFSPRPGIDALRPAARGAITNLYLAGDFCRTGWPATMEGAVRSGYLAAAALLNDHTGEPAPSLVPDLEPERLYRLIGGI